MKFQMFPPFLLSIEVFPEKIEQIDPEGAPRKQEYYSLVTSSVSVSLIFIVGKADEIFRNIKYSFREFINEPLIKPP